MLEPAKNWVHELTALGDECNEKLKTGFENDNEKTEYFKKLGENVREFLRNKRDYKPEKQEAEGGELSKEQKELAVAANVSTSILRRLERNLYEGGGVFKQVLRAEDKFRTIDKLSAAEFKDGFDRFFEMSKTEKWYDKKTATNTLP